ncbi:hypothetical protein F2Q70_00011266 [Brassica cretica]|uniref:malate dehydrogenase n=1 Tax=Brassica cretica TaxID=69181 RepID=A0A8S9M5L5_BRACR|nr:hypothetical protein F2Q70_00011266 [Brassica cretica]
MVDMSICCSEHDVSMCFSEHGGTSLMSWTPWPEPVRNLALAAVELASFGAGCPPPSLGRINHSTWKPEAGGRTQTRGQEPGTLRQEPKTWRQEPGGRNLEAGNWNLLSFLQLTRTVLDFTGPSELADCLKDVNVVVIPAGVPRKHAVADNCPNAFIHIINNPVNSAVPIAAQVLKKKEFQELTVRDSECWNWGRDAKAGAGSATLSIAYAAARFVESSLRALDGDGDVYECSFVESDLQGLTEYEHKALEALKPELKASIDKGIAFANKPAN